MTLEDLRRATGACNSKQAELETAREERDAHIRAAIDSGETYAAVSRATGLTRKVLYRIAPADSQVPTVDNPVVVVGNEHRSIYLPGHSYDSDLVAIADGDNAAYGLAAVTIVAHGGSAGGHRIYWTEGQQLHLEDGTVVAHNLVEAGQLVKHLGWTNGRYISWERIQNVQTALRSASTELGYLNADD